MRKGIIKYYFLFFVVFLSMQLSAQECEWLETTSTPWGAYASVATDEKNDVVIVGRYPTGFFIQSILFPPATTRSDGFLAKFSDSGTIKWVKPATPSNLSSQIFFYRVKTDKKNNIYALGQMNGTVDFGNGISIATQNSTSGTTVIIKYNSSGVTQWATTIEDSVTLYNSVEIAIADNGEVCAGFTATSEVKFRGTSQTVAVDPFKPYKSFGIVRFDSSGNFIKAKLFGGGLHLNHLEDMGIDRHHNVYATVYSQGASLGTKTHNKRGYIIAKIDSSLNVTNSRLIAVKELGGYAFGLNTGARISVQSNGKCAFTAHMGDTINFGGITVVAETSNLSNFSRIPSNNFIAFYDSSLNPVWVRKEGAKSKKVRTLPSGGVIIKHGLIFFGGFFSWGSTSFGGIPLTPKDSSINGGSGSYFVKMDTLGNVLWAFAANAASVASMAVDNNFNSLVTGSFNDTIQVFNKSAVTYNNTTQSYFLAKIKDYRIVRGYVNPGPYCAGDSFEVPYTKRGRYDTGNYFIAELSDSAGNFNGGQRELGRIKSENSGIVKGKLPLFNVATNSKYRIRILSTKPIVQSFYKEDTLRLLIYSKDTANAGPDRYVCKGEEVRLSTTGGSKWLWSPANKLVDSSEASNRQPLIKLYDSTQEYRIVISDSSGCGDIDTDFVKIYVRPEINIKIQGDSQICRGFRQTLQAQTAGGDSTQYWYIWKMVSLNLEVGKSSNLFVRPFNTTEYMVIVGDSCGDKIDTSYFTVNVQSNLKANPSKDTTICKGKTAQLSVIGTGCNPNKYTYEWTEKGSSNVLSNKDTLLTTPITTTQYQVILKDTSTLLIDTATITVTVDSVFNISTTKDSTICQGQTIDLKANVFSCDTSNMVYRWTANNNQLSTNNKITISPTQTTTYTVIGENTFNNLKDTAQVTITVRDPLQLIINQDSTICFGEQAELRATATGGRTTTHQIQWFVNNNLISNNPITKIQPSITTTYKALLSDGCTVNNDSVSITITVRPKLDITVNQDSTICIGEEAELRAISSGGLTTALQLQWFANNNLITNNPITKVQPTTTATYKALLSDGCTIPNDSSEITITVRPKLTLTLNTDTTICIGEEAELRAITNGGNPNAYNIQWSTNNNPLSTNNILKVAPTQTTTYRALLTDNCTTPSDSSELTITVRPALQLTTVAKDSICSNEILLLTATPSGGRITNHQIQWQTDNSLWTSTQNPATDTPQITTRYIAALSDNCSPTVYDTLDVIVLPIPRAYFTATPLNGCPPLKITLQDQSTANDSTQNIWTIGAAEYQGTATQSYELLKQGVYDIKFNVKNKLGCSDEKTRQNVITVFAKPKADFIIKPDIKEVEEPLQLYNLSQSYNSILWDMGDGNILAPQYGKDTSYKYGENDTGNRTVQLIAINNQGCKDTSKQQILLFDKVNCTIPTAFTPNGDGLNNIFKPVCVGVANYTLTIYNRWGQVIYQRENGAWNGNYSDQPLPMGVYMYKIQINAQSKKKKLTYGTVQLIR